MLRSNLIIAANALSLAVDDACEEVELASGSHNAQVEDVSQLFTQVCIMIAKFGEGWQDEVRCPHHS